MVARFSFLYRRAYTVSYTHLDVYKRQEDYSWITKGLDVASAHLQLSAEAVSGTGMLPRSIRTAVSYTHLDVYKRQQYS